MNKNYATPSSINQNYYQTLEEYIQKIKIIINVDIVPFKN